jgi:hypothetical protein
MCRAGGRRCSGSRSGSGSHAVTAGSGSGDPDRDAYEERAAEFRGRVAAGETPTGVLAGRHAETSMRLLERALRLDREDRGDS